MLPLATRRSLTPPSRFPRRAAERFWLVVYVAGAFTWTTLASVDMADKVEAKSPPAEMSGNNRTVALAGAIFSYLFGPLVLFYGHKIQATLVVLNALIACGISSFVLSLQYMQATNAEVSGGKMMPSQLRNLFKVLLSTFTMATAALKVKNFNIALKGGVVASLVATLILDQIPGQFNCACALGPEAYPCSPVQNPGLYNVEPKCFKDKWMRFAIRAAVVSVASYASTYIGKVVTSLNTCMVAANLCNEAIFDTALAVMPSYGSRMQPFRMIAFSFWVLFGYTVQYVCDKFDNGKEVVILQQWLFRSIWATGKVVMVPLLMINGIAQKLEKAGEEASAGASGAGGGGGVSGGLCFLYGLLFNPSTAKIVMLVINTVMLGLAAGVLLLSTELVDIAEAGYFDPAFVGILMATSVVLMVVSLCGCGGAITRKKTFLVPYGALLIFIMVIELSVVGAFWDKYKALDAVDAGAKLKGYTSEAFASGNCTTLGTPPYGTANPYEVQCQTQRWLETFVNDQCVYKGAADVHALTEEAVVTLRNGDFHQLRYYGRQLSFITTTEATIASCLYMHNSTINSPTGEGAYCVCSYVLLQKVEQIKRIGIVAVALCAVQVLLVLCVFILLGFDPIVIAQTQVMSAVDKIRKKTMV